MPHVFITKTNWLKLFRETIIIYSENRSEPYIHTVINKENCFIVKVRSTYSSNCDFNG